MVISPNSSVLYTLIFLSFIFFKVFSEGWPNLLFFPTPISAYWGFTAFKNSDVVDVFEPWCATFRIVDFNVFLFSSNIFFSAISSISPVNNIENFL